MYGMTGRCKPVVLGKLHGTYTSACSALIDSIGRKCVSVAPPRSRAHPTGTPPAPLSTGKLGHFYPFDNKVLGLCSVQCRAVARNRSRDWSARFRSVRRALVHSEFNASDASNLLSARYRACLVMLFRDKCFGMSGIWLPNREVRQRGAERGSVRHDRGAWRTRTDSSERCSLLCIVWSM
jgi:hypothetical protein